MKDLGNVAGSTTAGPRESLATWCGLAACAALALLIRGYGFGQEDQFLYLPFLYQWENPSLFPGDPLLTLGLGKLSATWPLAYLLSRLLGWWPAFFLLHLAATLLSLAAVRRIAAAVWPSRTSAWMCVLLWLPAYDVPGVGIATFDTYFTTRCVGWAVCLWALALFLERRRLWAAALLAAGVFLHVASVLPLAGGMWVVLLAKKRWRDAGLFAAVLGAACAGLALYGRAAGLSTAPFERFGTELFPSLVRFLPDVFPAGWPPSTWLAMGVVLAAALVAGLAYVSGPLKSGPGTELAGVTAGAVLLAVLGLAAASARWVLPAQLTLGRGVAWAVFFTACWASGRLVALLDSDRWLGKLAALYLAGSWIMGAGASHAMIVGLLVLLGAGLTGPETAEGLRKPARLRGGLALLLGGVLALLQAHWLFALPRFGLNREASGLPAGLLMAALGGAALWALKGRVPAIAGAGAVLVCTLALVPPTPVIRLWGGLPVWAAWSPPARAETLRLTLGDEAARQAKALEALVRERVPPDATVLVPPGWTTFRTGALRSPFVSAKDASGMLFSRAFAAEWLKKMTLVRARFPVPRAPEDRLRISTGELLGLAAAHRAIRLEYAVARQPYPFPVVGRAGGWTLYRLDGAEGQPAPPGANPAVE